jgi:hypothetical protein
MRALFGIAITLKQQQKKFFSRFHVVLHSFLLTYFFPSTRILEKLKGSQLAK